MTLPGLRAQCRREWIATGRRAGTGADGKLSMIVVDDLGRTARFVELRHLEYFIAVATDLNFSRAAQRIHVVQSSLSTAVNKLERELGVELFDRTKRPIELTEAGVEFRRQAQAVLEASQRARASMDPHREQIAGTVTLGTLLTCGTLDLAAILAEFRRLHPFVRVLLRQNMDESPDHLNAVADGGLDVALVSTVTPTSPSLEVNQVSVEPMVLLCDKTHPLAGRPSIRLPDVIGHDLIQFPGGWGIRKRLDAAFAVADGPPAVAYEVADYAMAAELVRHGLAVTILPVSVAVRFLELRRIPIEPALTWTLYVASAPPPFVKRAAAELVALVLSRVDARTS